MKKTIYTMWERCTENYAGLPAVRWLVKKDIHERSYKEINDVVSGLRKGAAALGFEHKHISLVGTNSAEWIEAYMSVVTSTNTAVPLDSALPAEDLVELIDRSDSEGVFLDPKFSSLIDAIKANCKKVRKIWMLSDEAAEGTESMKDLMAAGEGAAEAAIPEEDDISMIVFTSGTTGKSKGVMLTQSNLYTNIEAILYDMDPGLVFLSVLPVHHCFCLVMDWLNGFWMGAVLCINDSLMHLVRNMTIFNPDVMLMVPLMVETIYKRLRTVDPSIPAEIVSKKVFGTNLKYIFTGGAHLEPYYIDEFRKYGIDVYEGYGMSECSPVISSNKIGDSKPGSIGRPLPNVEIKFEDGEILVRSTSVMKGYYKMEKETEETLRDGWLHTGDKGYLDEDGFLFINGRVKNLIILSNGENNMLTARIFPDPDTTANMTEEEIQSGLRKVLDDYNRQQPTYKQLSSLVVRKYPFLKNTTRKIKRTEVLRDEPEA